MGAYGLQLTWSFHFGYEPRLNWAVFSMSVGNTRHRADFAGATFTHFIPIPKSHHAKNFD
jgi:hypothetical protein